MSAELKEILNEVRALNESLRRLAGCVDGCSMRIIGGTPSTRNARADLATDRDGARTYALKEEIHDSDDVYLRKGSMFTVFADGSIKWDGQTKTEDADSTAKTTIWFKNRSGAIIGPPKSHWSGEMTVEGHWYAYAQDSEPDERGSGIFGEMGDECLIGIEED